MKEFCFWLVMIVCFIGLLLCNQYTGYKQAEKNFLKSCITQNELVLDDIKFACIQCPAKENKNVQNDKH